MTTGPSIHFLKVYPYPTAIGGEGTELRYKTRDGLPQLARFPYPMTFVEAAQALLNHRRLLTESQRVRD